MPLRRDLENSRPPLQVLIIVDSKVQTQLNITCIVRIRGEPVVFPRKLVVVGCLDLELEVSA